MDPLPRAVWIDAVAHRLQRHWRTVDPIELEAVAGELWADEQLRALPPARAAAAWLRPVCEESHADRVDRALANRC